MSSHDSHDAHDPLDDAPVDSHDAVTPRGGFMARPGLKSPPRHAVVVRVGDAPESEDIPVARASVPPPAPASEPAAVSASDKITLRAIPTPSTPPPAVTSDAAPPSAPLRAMESVPPPSDAPVAHSVREPSSSGPRSRRSAGSRWTIVIAAAAGLLLGLASVATTMRTQHGAARAPAAAPTLDAARVRAPTAAPTAVPSVSALPQSQPVSEPRAGSQPPASRPASPGAKRSIF